MKKGKRAKSQFFFSNDIHPYYNVNHRENAVQFTNCMRKRTNIPLDDCER